MVLKDGYELNIDCSPNQHCLDSMVYSRSLYRDHVLACSRFLELNELLLLKPFHYLIFIIEHAIKRSWIFMFIPKTIFRRKI